MHAQGQLTNTPSSDILTQICISEKKLAESTSCHSICQMVKTKTECSISFIFKYDCHIGKMNQHSKINYTKAK